MKNNVESCVRSEPRGNVIAHILYTQFLPSDLSKAYILPINRTYVKIYTFSNDQDEFQDMIEVLRIWEKLHGPCYHGVTVIITSF